MGSPDPLLPISDLPAGFAPVTCRAVREETPTVRTFVLEPADPSFLAFEAGQALALRVDTADGPLVRTFSVSSAPGAGRTLELTILDVLNFSNKAPCEQFEHFVP